MRWLLLAAVCIAISSRIVTFDVQNYFGTFSLTIHVKTQR